MKKILPDWVYQLYSDLDCVAADIFGETSVVSVVWPVLAVTALGVIVWVLL